MDAQRTPTHCASVAFRGWSIVASGFDYSDLIGKRFEYGAMGPDTYDCYGLVREMFRRQGVVVPEYSTKGLVTTGVGRALAGIRDWQLVEEKPGVMALMKLQETLHVGYLLPYGRMIHTLERSGGVCVERFEPWRVKLIGCYVYRSLEKSAG
jgi:cell wall-associated NlpC family hydrolase